MSGPGCLLGSRHSDGAQTLVTTTITLATLLIVRPEADLIARSLGHLGHSDHLGHSVTWSLGHLVTWSQVTIPLISTL